MEEGHQADQIKEGELGGRVLLLADLPPEWASRAIDQVLEPVELAFEVSKR
jgi:hypothetical protein